MLFMLLSIIATVAVAALNAEDYTVIAYGTLGEGGAQWRRYSSGAIVVEEGNLYHWPSAEIRGSQPFILQLTFNGPLNVISTRAFGDMIDVASGVTRMENIINWEYVNKSHITDMGSMFSWLGGGVTGAYPRHNLSHILATFDTSDVTNMSRMFSNARTGATLYLQNWDTGNVTNMYRMFDGARMSSLSVADWDVSSITDMSRMFARTFFLTSLDLSGWDTSNVTDMSEMFSKMSGSIVEDALPHHYFSRLVSLNLSSFDTRNVENMSNMFYRTQSLRELHLGYHFYFITAEGSNCVGLPPVPQNDRFTGYWQNVYTGTVSNPQGIHVLTSDQLVQYFDGSTMADIWVWQPVYVEEEIEPYGSITGAFTIPNPVRPITIELLSGTEIGRNASYAITMPAPPNAYTTVDFNFDYLPPGTYSLVFTKLGHTSFTINNIVVTEAEDVNLTYDPRFPQQLPLLPGNITGNGQVNIRDLNVMLQNWMGSCEYANLTGSGQVNASDLNLLLRNWMAESVVVD